MNDVKLIGRLTRDVDYQVSMNGTQIAHMTIAVDRPVKQGQDKQADFIRITVFGKQAENASKYLAKGRQVAISGRIQTGSYQKDGQTVYTTDVIADRVEYLGNKGSDDNSQPGYAPQQVASQGGLNEPVQDPGFAQESFDFPDSFEAAEEDIPF